MELIGPGSVIIDIAAGGGASRAPRPVQVRPLRDARGAGLGAGQRADRRFPGHPDEQRQVQRIELPESSENLKVMVCGFTEAHARVENDVLFGDSQFDCILC